ncbi:MAG: hypothetical protein M3O30_11120 [Planctomycetota bacterium]|nr:hypothetical protein [Planctomycetota bacterium]
MTDVLDDSPNELIDLPKSVVSDRPTSPRFPIRHPLVNRIHWGALCLLSTLVTFIAIQWSYRHGRLCVSPFYDDVGYFNDGFLRLRDWDQGGISGLFRGLMQAPPHSLFSSMLAMFAFAIFGVHAWAPYAISGIVVLAFLSAAEWLTGPIPKSQRLIVLAIIVSSRFVLTSIVNFKPDFAWGIACAVAVLGAFRWPLHAISPFRLLAIGACWGLALVIKPSTFPMTLCLFFLTMFLTAITDSASRTSRLSRVSSVVGVAAIVASPYYLFAGRDTFNYFWSNTFGVNKAPWEVHGSALFHARYYLDGEGGRFMMGWHLWAYLAIAALGGLVAWFKRPQLRRRIVALSVVTFVAYLIPTIPKVKGLELDAPFCALIILLACFGFLQISSATSHMAWRWPHRLVYAAVILLLVFVEMPTSMWEPYSREVVAIRRINDEVFNTIVARAGANRTSVIATTDNIGAGQGIMQFRAYEAGLPYDFTNLEPFQDLPWATEKLRLASFVIASEGGNIDNPAFEVSTQQASHTLDWIRSSKQFDEIGSAAAFNGKRYFVFSNRLRGFGGFDLVDGLSHPYSIQPDSNLPLVRVAKGPSTKLRLFNPQPASPLLQIRAFNRLAGQGMKILVDGKQIAILRLNCCPDFNKCDPFSIPLNLAAGVHDLEIQYLKPNEGADWKNSVVFQQLQIKPMEPAEMSDQSPQLAR